MASHLSWHRNLTNGEGKCGVPMWSGGCPDGFCDAPAYGPQEPGQERYGTWGEGWHNGRWCAGGVFTPGYSSGLACYVHGGPQRPTAPAPGDPA